MTTKKISGFATMTLLLAALAAPLQAQDKAARAASLEKQADELLQKGVEFDRVADLYRDAGHLRMEGDPQGVQDLLRAGALAYYLGDRAQASEDLSNAAAIAARFGDVRIAARAYLDAATAAAEAGRDARALEFATTAHQLAQSPLLAAVERSTLLRRIDQGVGQ